MTTPIPNVPCPHCQQAIELTEALLRQWVQEIKNSPGGQAYLVRLLSQHGSPTNSPIKLAAAKLREMFPAIRGER